MVWTVPNILTMLRLASAPGLLLAFAILERPMADLVALTLFIAAALTDFVDGWLARRWDQTSAIGAMLDPIADKAMVITALAALLGLYGFSWWMSLPVAVIFCREVTVSGVREYLGDIKLPVTRLAKWKTTAQMVAIAALLLGTPSGPDRAVADILGNSTPLPDIRHAVPPGPIWLQALGLVLLWLAAALTLVTGWDYVTKAIAHIRHRESDGKAGGAATGETV